MSKKLESRQDVLDVWVSKWGVFNWEKIIGAYKDWANWSLGLFGEIASYTDRESFNLVSIYEILYSPESNFFEVMFWNKWKTQKNSLYTLQYEWKICEYHKIICAISKDPLQYLIDNLTETTS